MVFAIGDPVPRHPSQLYEAGLEGALLFIILWRLKGLSFKPGTMVCVFLSGYGILRFFDVLVFSDEVGVAKPARAVFEAAAQGLGMALGEMAHIGDREQKDVAGPRAAGAKAILCTVVKDRGSERTQADAVCRDFRDLSAIVERLNDG